MLPRALTRCYRLRALLDQPQALQIVCQRVGVSEVAVPAAHACVHNRGFAAAVPDDQASNYDVPAGHANSDLNNWVAHIGLNRRRDLMLRSDIFLSTTEGRYSLKDIFKGKRAVVFGVPDMGKVCSEQHAPAYLALADKMHGMGVDKIYCVAVAQPETVKDWADKKGLTGSKVQPLADKNGAFARMLGLDIGEPDCNGPRSQRYVGIVDNGILLKLKVETSPGQVKAASAECVVEMLQKMKELGAWN